MTCSVAGCILDTDGYALCSGHAKRSERLGSPTAIWCSSCKRVCDGEDTRDAGLDARGWRCRRCLPKICALEECENEVHRRAAKYCTDKHRQRAKDRRLIEVRMLRRWGEVEIPPATCFECGGAFVPKRRGMGRGRTLYCARACKLRAWRRRKKEAS